MSLDSLATLFMMGAAVQARQEQMKQQDPVRYKCANAFSQAYLGTDVEARIIARNWKEFQDCCANVTCFMMASGLIEDDEEVGIAYLKKLVAKKPNVKTQGLVFELRRNSAVVVLLDKDASIG